ncbi:MAG: helix-turn-helix domain-containing protein [Oscillospiraceae bacterium]|nr:helix-turn-helix domain-containing protein [Oscillospiraceae bacterium]
MSRCRSCVFRDRMVGCEGATCAYMLHTGQSRLKEVYARLGVTSVTEEVREAMRPKNCTHYIKGPRRDLRRKQIRLDGSQARSVRPSATAEKEPVLRALYKAGLSDVKISRLAGISKTAVLLWRRRTGRAPNKQDTPKGRPKRLDRERARELYEQGRTDREIGELLGVNENTVWDWRKKEGLQSNGAKKSEARRVAMKELYEQGMSDYAIAAALGVRRNAVICWRKRTGLPTRYRSGQGAGEGERDGAV